MPLLRPGYLEASQQLVGNGRRWGQTELLRAAERAQLRNTGWPMGVVLDGEGLRPTPTSTGIHFRMHRDRNEGGPGWEDFWNFRLDGSYYLARVFEEEFGPPSFQVSGGHPQRAIWFDTRIWRVCEAVMHSAALYRELGVPPDEPYLLSVNHGGLEQREFWTSEMRFVRRGKVSDEDCATWTRQVTQDLVVAEIKSLVAEISRGLFVLFQFTEIPDQTMFEIIEGFLRSRI